MKKLFLAAFLLLVPALAQAQNEHLPGQMPDENSTEYHIRTGEQARMERERNEANTRPAAPVKANYVNRWPGFIPLAVSRKKRE